mgnify:CR=1 FL=1
MANAQTAMLKGFVCPKCRLLFSVKSELIGEKVTCQSCSVILQIPRKEDKISVLQPGLKADLGADLPDLKFDGYRDNWIEAIPEEFSAEYAGKLPWHMLLPAGMIGVFLIASLFVVFSTTEKRPVEVNHERLVPVVDSFEGKNDVSNEEALVFLNKLAEAKDVGELSRLVVPWSSMEKDLRSYYSQRGVDLPDIQEVISIEPVSDHANYFFVEAKGVDGSSIVVVLLRGSTGALVLDWKTLEIYCSIPWGDLSSKLANETQTIRAMSLKVEYYNYGFSSDEWQSFELTRTGSDVSYIGYVRRGSKLERQLLPIGSSSIAQLFTLNVRLPEGAESTNQLVIEEVLQNNWLTETSK